MSRPIPPHGTAARRLGTRTKNRPGCDCDPCVRALRRHRKIADLRRRKGIPADVPTGPVTEHVKMLLAAGSSMQGIARDSGVNETTVRRVVRGASATVWRLTAERLMAVQIADDPRALVDATGTVRRLRALVAMGHAQQTLADEVGCAYTYISMLTHERRVQVTVATARSVERVYGALSMVTGPSAMARSNAARYGWHGPLAWDDDTIDDPRSVPQVDAPAPEPDESFNALDRWLMGESVVLSDTDRRAALSHLMQHTTLTPDQIGERLDGMTGDSVKRSWERIKRKARDAGQPVPYRRLVPAATPQRTAA